MNPKYSKIFGISSARYCNGKYKRKKPHEQVFALKSSIHRPIGVLKKRWRVQGGSLGCRALIINHPLTKRPIPLGRESVHGRSLPRVYALIVCVLHVYRNRSRASWYLPYSNFSFDPWQSWIDNWKLTIDNWEFLVGTHVSFVHQPSSISHHPSTLQRSESNDRTT